MKSRRFLAFAAAAAATGLILTGCSGSPDKGGAATGSEKLDGTGKTLNVLVGVNALYPDQQKAWFQSVSDDFKKETGATVNFETFASGNDELTKIQTSVLSNQGPDIYGLGTTFTPTAYSTGAFVTLGNKEWEKIGGRDKFVPSLLGISGPSKDKEIGVPFASRPFVMAYNKDILKAAGIDKLPTTWDELAADAKKATSGDVYGMAIGYADGYDPWKFAWAMAAQAGNPILDLKSKKATIDDDAVKAAYKSYFSWYQDGSVDPASIGWKNAQAITAFADGKAAFVPMVTPSSQITLDKSSVAGHYEYAVMPTIPPGATKRPSDGKEAASILSGDNWVVAKYSTNQDLAFALIKMLTSPDAQLNYYKTFGELPTTTEASDKVKSENPLLAPAVDAGAKSVGTPFSGAWADTQLALVNVVVQSLPNLQGGDLSSADIDAAVKAAQQAAQSALDKSK